MNPCLRPFLALSLAGAAAAANAHVMLEYQVAPAAASYRAAFKIGHGCGSSPTRQVVVHVPPAMRGARPMPKAGWTLEVTREPLAQPITSHGRTVTEDATRVTWTAKTRDDMLAAAHYDEFVLVAQTPEQPGTLHWPVQQICEEGRHDWTELPKPGEKPGDRKSPAPALEILPASGAGSHQH